MAGHAFRGSHRSLEGEHLLLHNHVERTIAVDLEVELDVFQGIAAETQPDGAQWQGHLVKAVAVGLGESPAVLKVDRHSSQGFSARNVAHIAGKGGTARPAGGVGTAYLVDFVLEGHDSGLAGQIFLEGGIRGGRLPFVEITRRKPRSQAGATGDEPFSSVFRYGIAVCLQLRKGALQELFPRYADGIALDVGGVADAVHVARYLAADETYQLVDAGLVHAERPVGRLGVGTRDT